jgi:hypothetical protein
MWQHFLTLTMLPFNYSMSLVRLHSRTCKIQCAVTSGPAFAIVVASTYSESTWPEYRMYTVHQRIHEVKKGYIQLTA